MVTPGEFTSIALSFDGVTAYPHFDRTAYKIRRIFVTLAGDGRSANVKLARDEQDMRCTLHPRVLSPVPNKFGEQGWTTIDLAVADSDLVRSLLASAVVAAARK